jgi:alpha-tubulin suppressor-like RCC1 family protein
MEFTSKHARMPGALGVVLALLTVAALACAGPSLAGVTKPVITKQPVSVTVEVGAQASFTAAATGTPNPSVQWEALYPEEGTWVALSKGQSTTYTLARAEAAENGTSYRARFHNSGGEAYTEEATLTVYEKPSVTRNPADTTVGLEQTAGFEAAAKGFPAPSVQWESSTDGGTEWSELAGETNAELDVTPTDASYNGREYRARFTNSWGSAVSSAAILTVQELAEVTRQPEEQLVLAGTQATFESASAHGFPLPSVQWEVSSDSGAQWSAVEGAKGDSLTLSPTTTAESGNEYRAAFTNAAGTAYSHAASLFVSATDYGAFGWGLNTHGQAGVGSNESSIPAPLPIDLHFVTAVSGGLRHSLALLANGTVESWGYDSHGQLGDEGAVATRAPILVEHLKGVTQIAAGGAHSLALLSNGTVMAWGDDESGQLGDGRNTDSEIPIPVPGLSGVIAIAAGEEDSLALLSNGTVMAWGNNERGQLGVTGKNDKNTPIEVKGLSGIRSIAAGGQFNLALRENGTVLAWGDDEEGQLGNREVLENVTERDEQEGFYSSTPVQVEDLAGVRAIAAGRTHALALLSGATVEAWGNDAEGELGNGAIEARAETPVPVSGLTGISSITAGDQESAALLGSGAVEAWGSDTDGTLGIGATGAPSDVPVEVHNISGAAGISAGGSQLLAFGASLPTVASVSPSAGPTAGGTTVTITGSGLGGASAVHFGSAGASSFMVDSSSSITAVAPAGTGTVDVTVTGPSGTSAVSPGDRFSYQPAPTVLKLSAKGGPASGGTPVTITGTELSGASEVDFGSVATNAVTVNSSTSITVTSPANVGGTLDVTVRTPGGVSAVSTKGRFKYTPNVEGLSPASGPLVGGGTVTISGSGFIPGTAGTAFKFGKAKVVSVECTSTTSCTVLAPAARAAGIVDVTVTSAKSKGTVNAGDRFTYE